LPSAPPVDVPAYIIAAVLGIVLCLWGVQLSRVIASITLASVLGYLTYIYVHKAFGSIALAILFMFIAIGIGFALGFTLFRLGLSIVFGYTLASILTKSVIGFRETALLLVLTIIFTALIYVLSKYILILLFVASGSALLFKSLVALGLAPTLSLIVIVVVATVGIYNQLKRVI
jgi:hypothetical protein